jgi:HlyD family secretion protein
MRETVLKGKRLFWLLIVTLTIILAVGFLYYVKAGINDGSALVVSSGETEIQQAVARTGDLTISASGSGEVVPASSVDLGFQHSGTVLELNVNVGDQVQPGDVLAKLQIDQSVTEREADLAGAQLQVLLAQQNLDQLYQAAQIVAAQALTAVEEARLSLEDLQDSDLEVAIAQQAVFEAEELVEDAEMALYIQNSSPSQEAYAIANASLMFKEKNLGEIQDEIARVEFKIKSAPNDLIRNGLEQQLLNLQLQLANQRVDYDQALYRYNVLDNAPDETELALAEAQLAAAQNQLADAQADLEKLQAGPDSSAIILTQAELSEAEAEWERLKNGPDPEEVALAEAQLAKAEAELALVQQEQLIVELVSPLVSTVLSVNTSVLDRVSTGNTILTLADIRQPTVEVYLDEIDLQHVQVGNRAAVVFDALPEKTFDGRILEVDPSLSNVNNTSTVKALVQLDSLPNQFISLPNGLNAAVDIISGETSNAVLIPIEAVHQQEDDGYIVYVINGDEVEARQVQVGLVDLTTAEILSGLQSGELVAIGNITIDQE